MQYKERREKSVGIYEHLIYEQNKFNALKRDGEKYALEKRENKDRDEGDKEQQL